MDILKFKGYEGTAELNMERGVCFGRILLIDDLVTYEAAAPSDLQKEFEAAVEDYLETCRELGRDPQVPLKGAFNVRLSPSLHKALVLRATEDCVSLNEIVSRACDAFVCQRDVNHNHNLTLTVNVEEVSTLTRIASNASEVKWEGGGFHVH